MDPEQLLEDRQPWLTRSCIGYETDPCCYETDPCCYETGPCCYETDPCCYETDPCCYETDPCCYETDPSDSTAHLQQHRLPLPWQHFHQEAQLWHQRLLQPAEVLVQQAGQCRQQLLSHSGGVQTAGKTRQHGNNLLEDGRVTGCLQMLEGTPANTTKQSHEDGRFGARGQPVQKDGHHLL